MIFGALYYTENEADDGYREIEAASLAEAKATLKAQILGEGGHGAFRLESLVSRKTDSAKENL